MEENIIQDTSNDVTEDLKIDLKKIFLALWQRKFLTIPTFILIVALFIALTFITEKKWTVNSNIYINKTNNTNYSEVNPFLLTEGVSTSLTNQYPLINEVEIMESSLVIEKVIQENDLRYAKMFGLIPTKRTGELISTAAFLGSKMLTIENKKGTQVITISYTSSDKEKAYNIVSSIITNYIQLQKELNSEKSKSDKSIIESEYRKAKESLNKKVNALRTLPTTSLSGSSNLAIMSAFSHPAQKAMSTLQGHYIASEQARVEIGEEETNVAQLASKLEWAKLVEEMSDTSKVLILKEPTLPRDWEYTSPKLFSNIILGIIIGTVFALIVFFLAESSDKKLTYSILGNSNIYDFEKESNMLFAELLANQDKKTAFILFEDIDKAKFAKFKGLSNIITTQADLSKDFTKAIKTAENAILFVSVKKTDKELYKLVKKLLINSGKDIIYEVLV